MKITMRDLDPAILKKLNQLDNVIAGFNPNDPDGYLTYGANGFYIKKTNDSYLRKVYSEEEIYNLEKIIYQKGNRLETSSLYTDMRCDNKVNAAFRTGLIDVTPEEAIHSDEFYLKDRRRDKVILLTHAGELIYAVDDEVVFEKDLVTAINEEFLIPNFNVHSINDMKIRGDVGDILLATTVGVFLYEKKTGRIELFNQMHTKFVVPLINEKVLIFGENETILCNEKGRNVEHYKHIQKAHHEAYQVVYNDEFVFVLARPFGKTNTYKLIHGWKLDEAGALLENIDTLIAKHRDNCSFNTRWIQLGRNYLFVISEFHGKLVLWKYSLAELYRKPREIVLEKMDFSAIENFAIVNDELFLVTIDARTYLITDEDEIEGSYTIDLPIDDIIFYKGKVYFTSDGAYSYFEIPVYESKEDVLTFKIYDDKESCNNIDIFVKGAKKENMITFVGRDSLEIKPSYYAIYNENNAIIKLMNCRSNYIEMSIAVDQNTNIEGIAVKRNKVFLR